MTSSARGSFALTNLVANRLLIPLLKSRAGRRLGRRLAVVEYLGRRSGQPRRLVTQYVIAGNTVHINVGMSDRKTWWRNFTPGHPLRLQLADHGYATTGHVVRQGDRIEVVAELEARAS
jgi:hypothetical protein